MNQRSIARLPLRIAVGGGIGSGKSTVVRRFGELGAVVIEADEVGHSVIAPGGPAYDAVASRWPETVVAGRVDRAALAEIVFRDQDALRELESVTHPAIAAEIARRASSVSEGVIVVELPVDFRLLGEGWVRVVVDAPEELRAARAVARGGDAADVLRRARAQPSREAWMTVADHVLVNEGTRGELVASVDALWRSLTNPEGARAAPRRVR